MRTGPPPKSDGKKDSQNKGNSDNTRRNKETEKEKTPAPTKKRAWVNLESALKGVPPNEQQEYKATENCWRCGRPGHRTFECYAFTTAKGTSLPAAPWKAAAAAPRVSPNGGKRKTTEEPEERPAAKQQKIVAVETMETNAVAPLWNSDSDF